jgi:polysaccharide export outer membrane protein
MRVTRSLLPLLVVAVVAAGCASRPVAYAPVAPNMRMAPNGIDNTVYGNVGAPAAAYPPSYARTYVPNNGYPARPVYPQTAGYAPAYAQAPAPVLGPPAQGPYTLDSGDRLRIVVFGQDGLTNSYAVDASGHIAMPLIGSVMAKGTTTDELANRIAEKLRDGYVREPHVAVEIEAYRPFFILGEVTQPGQYPYVANMTVETAVAIAGGFGPRALRKNIVLSRTYNGQQMRMVVPLNYELRPGDTLNIQERWF